MTPTLVNTAFGCLLLTLVLGAARRLLQKHALDFISNVVLGMSWIALTVFLAVRWNAAGFAPMSNQYESLVSLAWSILLVHFILSATQPLPGFSFWTTILALLFMGIASLLDPTVRPLMPALQSNWLLFHVSTTLLAYAFLGLAAVSSIAFLIRSKESSSVIGHRPLVISDIDSFSFRAIILGFILLTIGIILGAVWANEAWGTYWSWDPKETWSLITWFVYAVGIHLRRLHKWRDKRFAWYAILGFLCVLFTYFGVNYLLSGLHSYA